jgi:hypothetical protein
MVHYELALCRVLLVSRISLRKPRCRSRQLTARYRRIRTYFAMTSHWKEYDPFFESKADTYRSSSVAILREPSKIQLV